MDKDFSEGFMHDVADLLEYWQKIIQIMSI